MKTRLTKEESAHLISLGVPKEKASEELIENIYQKEYDEPRPKIFTLVDILSMLPKVIRYKTSVEDINITAELIIHWRDTLRTWEVAYGYAVPPHINNEELIDALYELCVECLENKYLKF